MDSVELELIQHVERLRETGIDLIGNTYSYLEVVSDSIGRWQSQGYGQEAFADVMSEEVEAESLDEVRDLDPPFKVNNLADLVSFKLLTISRDVEAFSEVLGEIEHGIELPHLQYLNGCSGSSTCSALLNWVQTVVEYSGRSIASAGGPIPEEDDIERFSPQCCWLAFLAISGQFAELEAENNVVTRLEQDLADFIQSSLSASTADDDGDEASGLPAGEVRKLPAQRLRTDSKASLFQGALLSWHFDADGRLTNLEPLSISAVQSRIQNGAAARPRGWSTSEVSKLFKAVFGQDGYSRYTHLLTNDPACLRRLLDDERGGRERLDGNSSVDNSGDW